MPAVLGITFASPVTAFGVYITGVDHAHGLTSVVFGPGAFLLPNTADASGSTGVQCFGVLSATPIAAVLFEDVPVDPLLRDIMGFDDIEIAGVPEPTTVLLALTGLAALGGGAARRRHG